MFLETAIEYVKGIGPARGEILRKELNIHVVGDLLFTYPFRYIDRTVFHLVKDASIDGDSVQVRGELISMEKIKGKNNRSRLECVLKDSSGFIYLVWFQSVSWFEKYLQEGNEYIAFGKVTLFSGNKTIVHPEMELLADVNTELMPTFDPVYSSTEKLEARGLDNRARRKIVKSILESLLADDVPETLPTYVIEKLKLCTRLQALRWIHFPSNENQKAQAIKRIKFEEFFYLQLRLIISKVYRKNKFKSLPFEHVGNTFMTFYNEKMPFELTNAQKRVVKEIRADLGRPQQMNRLLQGDVGSGKTIVALLTMLLAIDNGFQACLMAPTEILATQHYIALSDLVQGLPVKIGFLSGSIKGKKRQEILQSASDGSLHILIGTHALIEPDVLFKSLGLAIIDEQHRFGVAQRASLWKKNMEFAPHILVMTATPIPRTLAMTLYGDLDVSIINELPPGRQIIKTIHIYENSRDKMIHFLHSEIEKGRQVYIVYPLIEESEKLDLKNLQEGYERLLQYFPQPHFQISIVHGRMKAKDKEWEMQRFINKTTQIMVATTVIEVGVNVPNATVMVIENTERFGLSQLHQLRGRVGRGGDQSYCILMTDVKLTKEGRKRIETMVKTNNGFDIAEADLELRGPGDLQGTQQSGLLDFKLLNIVHDKAIMDVGRELALRIMESDPMLDRDLHEPIKKQIQKLRIKHIDWGRIS